MLPRKSQHTAARCESPISRRINRTLHTSPNRFALATDNTHEIESLGAQRDDIWQPRLQISRFAKYFHYFSILSVALMSVLPVQSTKLCKARKIIGGELHGSTDGRGEIIKLYLAQCVFACERTCVWEYL